MSTTEVILREKVENLGSEADVVTVKRGFARNFLIPQGKAYEATAGNLRHIEQLKKVRALREAEELQEAEAMAAKLKKLRITLELSIGQGGKAFGSITTADIANVIAEKSKYTVDRHKIELDKPIKSTGSYDIPIRIHPDVEASVSIRVKAQEEDEEGAEDKSADS